MLITLKDKETRNKFLILIGLMILIRIGSIIPIPGISTDYMKNLLSNDGFGFLILITGNSFSQMSLFALSISPYITASIIVQLMTVVIPRLEELTKDGKTGREQIEKITNILGICLAFIQALGMALVLGKQGLIVNYTWWMVILMTVIWTVGAAILMFIGEKITKMNIGNGISYILICNILSTFPNDVLNLFEVFIKNKKPAFMVLNITIIMMLFGILLLSVIYLATTEKQVLIVFSRKVNGMSNKQYLPIQLNICNVMPIIFSGSILSFPILLNAFLPNIDILQRFSHYLNQNNWFNPINWKYSVGAVIYIILTYFFASFYLEINFNVFEIAKNLKMQGAAIAGIRPGKETAEYLKNLSEKIARMGTTFMLLIVLIFTFLTHIFGISALSIGGTSILICVSVIMESKKAILTQLQSAKNRSYYMGISKNNLFKARRR